MTDAIQVDAFLPHPPRRVWRALTEPELLAEWMMSGDFRLEVGHVYTMDGLPRPGTGFSGAVRAEVLAFEPERMLRLGWRDADPESPARADWTITWTLVPEGRGTRLFLVHDGFDGDNPFQQRARSIMDGGWRSSVAGRFAGLLDRLGTADRYERLAGGFLDRIAGTAPAAWDAPSPCAGWTARDVVAHVVNGHRGILAAVSGERPVPAYGVGVGPMDGAPPVEPGADLAAAFTDCRDRMLAVLADPGLAATPLPFSPLGPVPVAVAVDLIGALELLVHTWDLACASGGDATLDAELAARTHEALLPHRDALFATGAFAPGVEPPPGADAQAALLTFAGRSLAPPVGAG